MVPIHTVQPVTMGVGASRLKVVHASPKATVRAASTRWTNAWCSLLPRLSGGVPYASFGDTSSSLIRELGVDTEVTTSSLLIWFWKYSMRGYITSHPQSPYTNTSLCKVAVFAWLTLCANWAILKPSEGGRQLWFHGWKKNQIWKHQCMLNKSTTETRCHLRNRPCWYVMKVWQVATGHLKYRGPMKP